MYLRYFFRHLEAQSRQYLFMPVKQDAHDRVDRWVIEFAFFSIDKTMV